MDKDHLKREADYVVESEKKAKGHIVRKFVNSDDTIISYPKNKFRPADFLKKTGIGNEYDELCELLSKMYQYNEDYVGLRTREVEVYLALTGEYLEITTDLRNWVSKYFEHRIKIRNPRDKNDPFATFRRLEQEYYELIARKLQIKGTISYVFLDGVTKYVVWYLYQTTWRSKLKFISDGRYKFSYTPSDPIFIKLAGTYLAQYGLQEHCLNRFIDGIKEACDNVLFVDIESKTPSDLFKDMEIMASDILHMRPFLLKNFNPEKTAIPIGSKKYIVWDWALNGIGIITFGTSKHLLSRTQKIMDESSVRLRIDGILLDYNFPWQTVTDLIGDQGLIINYYVLQQFWEKLFSFYEQIDFDRIRQRSQAKKTDEIINDDEFALSCQNISDDDVSFKEERGFKKQKIRPLRLLSLLNFLEKHFDCEIRQGKGSEVIAYRSDAKIIRFGRHKPNPIVPFERVNLALKRLKISRQEWCRVVYS